MAELPVLIEFGLSHYCEKARWGLERCGVAYDREAHVPGPHRFSVRGCGGKGSVPCLRFPAGAGSTDDSQTILQWADEQAAAAGRGHPLFPEAAREEVERLCARFDRTLGPSVRVWVYYYLIDTQEVAAAIAEPRTPWVERMVLRWGGWVLLRMIMKQGMGINPERAAKCKSRIQQVFGEVDALLADGRPFLCGQAFTAADLTFAALALPALGQAYSVAPGLSENTPPAFREQVEELRATPAGRHALRMWETERNRVVA